MKKISVILLFAQLVTPALRADDVIPAATKEKMSAYKDTFTRAIADSKQDSRNAARPGGHSDFGKAVSAKAKEAREGGIGKSVSESSPGASKRIAAGREDSSGGKGATVSAEARSSAPGSRPSGVGRPDGVGGASGNGNGNASGGGNGNASGGGNGNASGGGNGNANGNGHGSSNSHKPAKK